jgi:hypothetical protein
MRGVSEPIHIISLGAGVQSSCMALMAAAGEITPMPAFAVFADTGDEPREVYTWLERLREMLPFRVKIAHKDVLHGKLSDNLFQWDHSQIPAYFRNEDGSIGIGKRQCTKHWKIVPVHQKIREATNTQRQRLPEGFVKLWQGISVDEVSRAKDSREPWIENRFPLLEKQMSRHACERWLQNRGLAAPKSACVFCPYRGPKQWRQSKSKPEEWAKITRIDAALNMRGEFLHPSCVPINNVDFRTEEEHGQLNLFNNECSGMCGV